MNASVYIYLGCANSSCQVGDLATRFKYVPVVPQAFALTPEEILMATDAELNEYVGIKKYAPYREERWDSKRGERLKELKQKIGERTGVQVMGRSATGERPVKKRKGKKERMKMLSKMEEVETEAVEAGTLPAEEVAILESNTAPSKRKREPEDEDGKQEGQTVAKKKRRRPKKKLEEA